MSVWWQQLVLVMLGGALGAAGRFWLGGAMLRQFGSGVPWGTIAANLVGSTTTLGPSASQESIRSSRRDSGVATVAGTPNAAATAAKSGRVSSVAVAAPKASVMYSRRIP